MSSLSKENASFNKTWIIMRFWFPDDELRSSQTVSQLSRYTSLVRYDVPWEYGNFT